MHNPLVPFWSRVGFLAMNRHQSHQSQSPKPITVHLHFGTARCQQVYEAAHIADDLMLPMLSQSVFLRKYDLMSSSLSFRV